MKQKSTQKASLSSEALRLLNNTAQAMGMGRSELLNRIVLERLGGTEGNRPRPADAC